MILKFINFTFGIFDNSSNDKANFIFQTKIKSQINLSENSKTYLNFGYDNETLNSEFINLFNLNSYDKKINLETFEYQWDNSSSFFKIGTSENISNLYSKACRYNNFSDVLGYCGSINAAGLKKNKILSQDNPIYFSISQDLSNGYQIATVYGGINGFLTKESFDTFGVQASLNKTNYGFSISYALRDTSIDRVNHYIGLNTFYEFDDNNLPIISLGYEIENSLAQIRKCNFMAGLTWNLTNGHLSIGVTRPENDTNLNSKYIYEVSYNYKFTDQISITPGFVIEETNSVNKSGIFCKFSLIY